MSKSAELLPRSLRPRNGLPLFFLFFNFFKLNRSRPGDLEESRAEFLENAETKDCPSIGSFFKYLITLALFIFLCVDRALGLFDSLVLSAFLRDSLVP